MSGDAAAVSLESGFEGVGIRVHWFIERAEAENNVRGCTDDFLVSFVSSSLIGMKGSTTNAATAILCPCNTCNFDPFVASHITIVVSAEPDMSIESLPIIAQVRHLTKSLWPLRK